MRASESTETKRDVIVQQLRRRILSGAYPRGMRLRQDQLAIDFDVSITPIREALRILESERLVVAEPHKGVRVAEIQLDRIEGIYVVRRLVESYAMKRAVNRLSKNDLRALRRLEGDNAEPDGSMAALGSDVDRNRAFHFYFYDRCGLPELTRQIEEIWNCFPWDLMLETEHRRSASKSEHADILAAAEYGEAERAALLVERHIANGMAALREHLTGAPGPDSFSID